MKQKRYKIAAMLGGSRIKIDLDNPAVALSSGPASAVEVDMLTTDKKRAVRVNFDPAVWILAEATERNGSKFQYLIGLPHKEGARE